MPSLSTPVGRYYGGKFLADEAIRAEGPEVPSADHATYA